MSPSQGSPHPLLLHEAARLGDLTGIERALVSGTQVDVRDEEGRTALHLAAGAREVRSIEALLAAGAEIDAEDRWKCTPLWYAVVGAGGTYVAGEFYRQQRPCVSALVRAGADPEHECWDPKFERFNPQTPWRRGEGVRRAFAAAMPGYGTDPEFCTEDKPFDVRGGLTSERGLWLDPTRIDACLGYMRKHGIEGCHVMHAVPESELAKLSELGRLPKLTNVTVRNRKGAAMPWIESLENIGRLTLLDRLQSLDLSRFRRIHSLSVAWSRRLVLPPVEAPLEELSLLHWTPKPSDLRMLREWKTLRTFSVGLGSLASLAGIDVLENIERASFSRLRNLVDVESLSSCRKIRSLRMNDCRRAVQLDVIRKLQDLEELVLVGRFGIPSLKFVEDLPRLRSLRLIHVDVEDGDLTPLLRVEQPVLLPHRRHYRQTEEQFAELHARQAEQHSRANLEAGGV